MSLQGRRIFITGGAGFIGSHLVGRLAHDNDITVFDTLDRDALGSTAKLPRVRLVRGDVLARSELIDAIRGHDLVFHLAAIAGTATVGRDARRTMIVNFVGTQHALEGAALAGSERAVVLSTSEVYGQVADRPTENDPTPLPPADHTRWGYAASKLAAEHLAFAYHARGQVGTVVIRPFNVYGPRQVGEGAIHDMVEAAVAGAPLVVYGDGSQVRAWCYVDDFVDGLLLCAERREALGAIFNLGNPDAAVTSHVLAETVRRIAGGSAIESRPKSGPDVQLRIPSIDRARNRLGFRPRVGIEEGIRRTLEWRRSPPPAEARP